MAVEVSSERDARWRKAVALHTELLRLYRQREAAKPAHVTSLASKALRSGHTGIAVTALIFLESRYLEDGAADRAKLVAGRIRALTPITKPASLARVDLERRLGVSNQVPPGDQSEQVSGTLAHLILLASYARLTKTRIREIQTLRDRAVEEERFLEAALCDLFRISEYRKTANKRGEKRAIEDLKSLEADHGVRDHFGKLYSDAVASSPPKRAAASRNRRARGK